MGEGQAGLDVRPEPWEARVQHKLDGAARPPAELELLLDPLRQRKVDSAHHRDAEVNL